MGNSIVTLILILITVLVSFASFQNVDSLNKLIFYPYVIKDRNEWWRFISHGFIHADIMHLVFNMLTLYFFGRNIEYIFNDIFGNQIIYPVFYLTALIASSVPSYFKHKEHSWYRSLGASGAVSAVLFASIVFSPWEILRINFFIPIPAILFGVGYVAYSNYMSKRGDDNIGHDAHMWGAVYGFIFPLVLKPGVLPYFFNQLMHPPFF